MSTLIYNIRLAGDATPDAWILIDGMFIADVGHGPHPEADTGIDAGGVLALPGVIDCHVHFREPGLTDKADIHSESRAAVAGGVTSYLDMPNTKPPTTTIECWQQKCAIARDNSAANYAFFIGATNDNLDQLLAADYARVPGVKVFMGSSTGNMLVDDNEMLERIFSNVDTVIAVHAEDQDIIGRNAELARAAANGAPVDIAKHSEIRSVEACYNSTRRAVEMARRHNSRLHICHISTEAELSLLDRGDPSSKRITSEVSPHHLMWCADDYSRKGTRIKMNPAVKTRADRDALRRAVADGLIDIVATDHAPHLLADKRGDALTATSGAPLVQYSLAWMLDHFDEPTVQRVMCENPAKVYRIDRRGRIAPGCYADIVLVDKAQRTVTDADTLSKCGWTPLDGETLTHRVVTTWVNGTCVYRAMDNTRGEVDDAATALPLEFSTKQQ